MYCDSFLFFILFSIMPLKAHGVVQAVYWVTYMIETKKYFERGLQP